LWIAKSSGLPVHEMADLGTGTTTDTGNVQPLARVK
jgi:hypothetical protein